MNKRIEIYGTTRQDLNGKCGVAIDFHYSKDATRCRYSIRLDSGEGFKARPSQIRAERVASRSKAKGKGKKGRGGRK